ncbi:ATP-binding protein [Methanobacterium sp. SMA-27]|uniref:sensor histidine kinase n=1 Tax=Methanobacterium sp. SMA-27 TaxID=1495336 RepID=UPI00064FA856|nr:ATP-binding protein [Methanobacterium sp. SMA-27]
MDSEKIKDNKYKKAEESLQNDIDPIEDKSKDELIQELRTHQIELEMQNDELREAHTRLLESQHKYFELYNFAPVGYITLDTNGLILNINLAGATLLDIGRLNLINTAFIQYIDPDYRNLFHNHIKKVPETETKESVELKLLKKDAEYSYVHFDSINVKDKYGNLKEFRIAITDITVQKEVEIKLQKYNLNINKLLNVEINDLEKAEIKLEKLIEQYKSSNIELEQFAYISSHDLKEPLRMITSFLQLLQKRYSADLDEDANEFINFAVDGAKRMNDMINDLLEYSRIGSTERKFEYLESEGIVEIVQSNLKQLIEDHEAIITNDPLPLIYANKQMMIQLFQNLIGNAIKYHSKETPEIHISINIVDDEYVFSVRDNGIGIDRKHLDRIFTIFQRLHSREEYDGTGIGLAISKRILQKHHGKIWVESELGKGTTFYFSLPNRNY